MTILGIDPSSTAIGIAVVACEAGAFELVDSTSLDLKGTTIKDPGATRKRPITADERFVELRFWCKAILRGWYDALGPHFAIVERPQTRFPTPAMMEATGMTRSLLCEFDWTILPPIQVRSARKLLGIGGNASKEQAAEHVRKALGDSAAGLDEHSTDAAAVAMAAWYQIEAAKEAA